MTRTALLGITAAVVFFLACMAHACDDKPGHNCRVVYIQKDSTSPMTATIVCD